MRKDTIILRLDNNSIYVNGAKVLGYENSNLPKQHFKFKTERLIHLEVKQVSYDKDTGTLKVSVVNYAPTQLSDTHGDYPKLPINKIEFEKMDWTKFRPLIYSYTLSRIKDSFFNADVEYDALKQSKKGDTEYLRLQTPNLFFREPRTPVIKNIQTLAKVKFEEATFYDGGIKFTARVKKYDLVREFSIENLKIKKEFENVKPWFVKKIGRYFTVTINLKFVDDQIQEVSAVSEDISRINEELIESIKTQRVLMLVKTARKKDDGKSVFNNDEIFGILDENNSDANIFNSSAINILEIIIKNGLAKNIKQLNYLSGDKQSINEKLRFTLRPHFGFLFKIETSTIQYFIWELLNSHATYLWEKTSRDGHFDLFIEEQISFIKANGREEYKRYYKNLDSKDFAFHLIEHEGADLTEEERFQAWKNKLESITSLISK